MARMSRPETGTANPATKFIEWKSDNKAFSFYDKVKKENVELPLPVRFVFLEHYHTVKGWDDKSASGITANEVFSIGSEPMTVRSFKGGEIAKGLYKDIKVKAQDAGGVYHRSIYCMDEDGNLVNLSLKGTGVQAYSEFFKDHKKDIEGANWFGVEEFTSGKKGAVKYHSPVFKVIKATTTQDERDVAKCVTILEDYMAEYKKSGKADVAKGDDDDDMPF